MALHCPLSLPGTFLAPLTLMLPHQLQGSVSLLHHLQQNVEAGLLGSILEAEPKVKMVGVSGGQKVDLKFVVLL